MSAEAKLRRLLQACGVDGWHEEHLVVCDECELDLGWDSDLGVDGCDVYMAHREMEREHLHRWARRVAGHAREDDDDEGWLGEEPVDLYG